MRGGRRCDICAYALEHGSWPPDHRGTHCYGCHRSWTSLSQSHCAECHRHFGSDAAGDAHRRRDQCVDPAGFDVWHTPTGPIFGGRDPAEMAARAAKARQGRAVKTEQARDAHHDQDTTPALPGPSRLEDGASCSG